MSPAGRRTEVPVLCRRLRIRRALQDHLACPYCFGSAEDVKTRVHARFCDFHPGVDPVVFGFPEGLRRDR